MAYAEALLLLAAIGNLTLGALAFRARSPMARPLALLAMCLFVVEFATAANHLFHAVEWRIIDASASALLPPLVLHVVLSFVGCVRRWRSLLIAAYVLFGGLGAASVASAPFMESPAWAMVFLIAWLPTAALELTLLVRHLVRSTDALEKSRSRLMLAALFVGGILSSTDLQADAGLAVPRLGALGQFASALLLAVVALRLRVFERSADLLYLVLTVVEAVFGYLAVFHFLGGHLGAMLFGTALLTAVLVFAVRELASATVAHRERVQRLSVLGRYAAQMTHDLKNPLAALHGALDVLEGPMSDEERREMVSLVREQAARMRTVIDRYDRAARVEPSLSVTDVTALIESVLAGRARALGQKVNVRTDLAVLPPCEMDPDLVSLALENVLDNAVEAMPNGGVLRVSTRAEGESVIVAVEDSGVGLDPRWSERAFDDFATTKPTGTGLGLAFVRRVALAHGGEASIHSQRPREGSWSTRVELRFFSLVGRSHLR